MKSYIMKYSLENLKNLKEQYKNYNNEIYRLILADRIISEQDYIIERLLEEKICVDSNNIK